MPNNIYIPKKFITKWDKANLDLLQESALKKIILLTWYKGVSNVSLDYIKTKLEPVEVNNLEISLRALKSNSFIDYNDKKITMTPRESYMSKTDTDDQDIVDKAYQLVDHWNNKKIIMHSKKTVGSFLNQLKSAIKEYGYEELTQAIDNYAVIVKGDMYWYTYRHPLKNFLSKVDNFLTANNPYQNYRDRGTHIKTNYKSVYDDLGGRHEKRSS